MASVPLRRDPEATRRTIGIVLYVLGMLAGGFLLVAMLFFPALLALFVPPLKKHGGGVFGWLEARYRGFLPAVIDQRVWLCAASVVALVVVGFFYGRSGAEFVPRIFEGDAVVAMRRAPSISLDEARKLDL